MVDLTRFETRIEAARKGLSSYYTDPRDAFLKVLHSYNFDVDVVHIGELIRFAIPTDKGAKKTGWYIFHTISDEKEAGLYIGVASYGSWNGDPFDSAKWTSRTIDSMSFLERAKYTELVARMKEEHRIAQEKVYAEAAFESSEILATSREADEDHPYLIKKKVKSYGLKQQGDILLVPAYGPSGLQSLQYIYPNGFKKNLSGGKMKGAFFCLDSDDKSSIYIAEGYATAATVREATGCAVYVAYNAGNIYEVCAHLQKVYPTARLVICGDDDKENKINAGRAKATQAAEGLKIECLFPPTAKDFNDWAQVVSLDEIKKFLSKPEIQIYVKGKNRSAEEEYAPTCGVLRDIYNYYNMSSGKWQPGFAIQTALACCSVILGRCYKSDKRHHPNLYFLNIGKSTTGKETAKSVIETIMEETSNGYLVAGDGYTSDGAVISALLDRPKHITVIDEFGRYIEASKGQQNSQKLEANTKIMEAFGRSNGIMRSKVYSTMTLKKEGTDIMNNKNIYNPSLTILAATTPDRFYAAIGIHSIKDGFINRFIINISELERGRYELKEEIPVPQAIKEWAKKVYERNGSQSHTAHDAPNFTVIHLLPEAIEAQKKYEDYYIAQMNVLEKVGIAEMAGRTNEIGSKVALIHALSRDPMTEVITAEDVEWANKYVLHCYENALSAMKRNLSSSDHEQHKMEILAALQDAAPDYIKLTDMYKVKPYSKHNKKYLIELLDVLVESGLIADRTSSGVGRPTREFVAIGKVS